MNKVTLLGWSFRGNIEQEMAVQLERSGNGPLAILQLDSVADTPDSKEPIAPRVTVLESLSRLIELPYEGYGLLTDGWLNELGRKDGGKRPILPWNPNS